LDISVVISKMGVLVTLMVVGFVCAKLGVTGPEFNKYANKCLVNVFLVCTIINSAVNIEPSLTNLQILEVFGLFCLSFLLFILVAWLSVRIFGIKGKDRGVARDLIIFMNNGFVGLPVVEAVLGVEAVFYASLSNIIFNILLYTLGYAQLQSDGFKTKFHISDLMNMPMVAVLISIILFVFRIPVPEMIADTVSTLSAATVPLSMIIIGTSLGAIPLKSSFGDWRAYAVSFVRLIVCPLVVALVMKPFVSNPYIIGVIIIIAACPSAMIITSLCISSNHNEALSSKSIFISTLLCAVTMPLVLWITM